MFLCNVSEITVAELRAVNTVADGERLRPVQQKGYSTGEILAPFLHIKLFCGVQSPLQSREPTSTDKTIVKLSKLRLGYKLLFLGLKTTRIFSGWEEKRLEMLFA